MSFTKSSTLSAYPCTLVKWDAIWLTSLQSTSKTLDSVMTSQVSHYFHSISHSLNICLYSDCLCTRDIQTPAFTMKRNSSSYFTLLCHMGSTSLLSSFDSPPLLSSSDTYYLSSLLHASPPLSCPDTYFLSALLPTFSPH